MGLRLGWLRGQQHLPGRNSQDLVNAVQSGNEKRAVLREISRRLLSDPEQRRENQQKLYAAGGVSALVGVLGVQKYTELAAVALGLLALDNSENQHAVREAGGIISLVELLGRTGTDVETVTAAAGALSDISLGNPANQDAVREAGGITALVSLFSSADPVVANPAAAALCNVSAKNPANQDAIREAGGIVILVKLLGSADPGIANAAAGAICNASAGNAANQVGRCTSYFAMARILIPLTCAPLQTINECFALALCSAVIWFLNLLLLHAGPQCLKVFHLDTMKSKNLKAVPRKPESEA